MEELILKMHEEAMELQKAVTEFKAIMGNLKDAIERKEIAEADFTFADEKDVEKAKIELKEIKRIIGMKPEICEEALKILKEREEEKQKAIKEEIKNEE